MLYFIPESCSFQTTFHNHVQFLPCVSFMQSWTINDIFINCLGERVGSLEDHTYSFAKINDIDIIFIYIGTIDYYFTFHSGIGNKFIHAVKGPQERRFSAARWPYYGCDGICQDIHINIRQNFYGSIIKPIVFYFNLYFIFAHKKMSCIYFKRNDNKNIKKITIKMKTLIKI